MTSTEVQLSVDQNQNKEEKKTEKSTTSPSQILMQPCDHISQFSGKKIRSKLIQALNYWMDVPDKYVSLFQKFIEGLHNSSLLFDDIEDYSTLRRGLPAAHVVYGVPMTLSSANFNMYKTLKDLLDSFPDEKKSELCLIIADQMVSLFTGQGMDIYWRDSAVCPTLDEYLDMIDKKTTGLFELSLKLMQLLSDKQHNFMPLIKVIGQYFQIRDDYANLKFDEYSDKKTFAEDLTEGKFSFVIVHAVSTYPQDQTILNILRLKTTNHTIKQFAVKHLESLGSMEFTLNSLEHLKKEIFDKLQVNSENPYIAEIMATLYLEKNEMKNLNETECLSKK